MGAQIYLYISKKDLQKETISESMRILGFEILKKKNPKF